MPGPAASIQLTPADFEQLTAWERAGTTPPRLARRARLILGSAAGLGSRALAQQERMSRTTVRRWLARFLAKRCDGLHDRPRSGRPTVITPTARALIVALACELPAERNVPLSRYSLSELSVEVTDRLGADDVALSRSSVWRVLINDALRPWRYRYWIFPRDPHFLERAGPVVDLYACQWRGRPLWSDEYVISADEKTSIQVRRRTQPTVPPGPHQAMRVEHEYERGGAVQYLAAWDVHRAVVFGRCEQTNPQARQHFLATIVADADGVLKVVRGTRADLVPDSDQDTELAKAAELLARVLGQDIERDDNGPRLTNDPVCGMDVDKTNSKNICAARRNDILLLRARL